MAFAVQVLARRFAFLLLQLPLLSFDPVEFGNGEDSDRLEIHPQRRRDAHPPGGRINAQVDVLDVLLHHFHGDFTQFDLRDHQYSLWCLMMRKMRSTSASSCKRSYNAALMTCRMRPRWSASSSSS